MTSSHKELLFLKRTLKVEPESVEFIGPDWKITRVILTADLRPDVSTFTPSPSNYLELRLIWWTQ